MLQGKNSSPIIALILTMLLAGCGSSPKPSYYTLTSEAPPTAALDVKTSYSVAVGPLSLPGALDRPQLTVRVNANQVEIDEFHRWAGPLKQELTRVISENMAQALGMPRVLTNSESGAGNADYRVALDVQRFDTTPGSGVVVEVAWTVQRAGGSQKSGHLLVQEAATDTKDYDALIAAHSRALGQVSHAIALDVLALAAGQS
jgi:uncharacterized protein